MARRHPTGLLDADLAMSRPERPPVGRDLVTRLDSIAVPKTTADQKQAALRYLTKRGLHDVADILGLIPRET